MRHFDVIRVTRRGQARYSRAHMVQSGFKRCRCPSVRLSSVCLSPAHATHFIQQYTARGGRISSRHIVTLFIHKSEVSTGLALTEQVLNYNVTSFSCSRLSETCCPGKTVALTRDMTSWSGAVKEHGRDRRAVDKARDQNGVWCNITGRGDCLQCKVSRVINTTCPSPFPYRMSEWVRRENVSLTICTRTYLASDTLFGVD